MKMLPELTLTLTAVPTSLNLPGLQTFDAPSHMAQGFFYSMMQVLRVAEGTTK